MPYLFVENFQTADDYANRPFYATFTRWLKYIAFFPRDFSAGLCVGIAAHDPTAAGNTFVTIAQAGAVRRFRHVRSNLALLYV